MLSQNTSEEKEAKKAEKVYLLRFWQEKHGVWRASLKPVKQVESEARYFHSLESFIGFIKQTFLKRK